LYWFVHSQSQAAICKALTTFHSSVTAQFYPFICYESSLQITVFTPAPYEWNPEMQ